MMEDNDNVMIAGQQTVVAAPKTSSDFFGSRKDPPPSAAFSANEQDKYTASKMDISFMPGTATVLYGTHGDAIDDMEAKVAQKMMKQEDLKKYHGSFMKETPTFFPTSEGKGKRDLYLVWMALLTLVFVGLVTFGFVSGLFLPSAGDASSQSLAPAMSFTERQAYMEELVKFLQLGPLEPSSPQEQALEWMSFQDDPLPVPTQLNTAGNALAGDTPYDTVRLEQRYALAVWYFAQGGPKLWATINRDSGSGWMNHGIGVHECDWHGVDCDDIKSFTTSAESARVVVGLRLNQAVGVVLTGTTLSTELGLLTHLRRLDFADQRLEGSIPNEWKSWSNLEMLVLSKNVLQGSIPEWIGDSWSRLNALAIDGNLFQGTLPSSFLALTNLRHLELQLNNKLSGRFDEVMRAIPELEFFDFSNTDLEGKIPIESMTELRVFTAWNTEKLAGSIPTEIGSWRKLETFSLDGNPLLEGTIATEFGLLSNLKTLQIKNAAVDGPLPTELGGLSNLKTMVLSILQLDSTLPLEYANLSSLEKMDFLVNYGLTGTIPTEFAKLVNLSYLDVAATSLSGSVPTEICALRLEWMTADCPGKITKPNDIVCECCTSCGEGNGQI